MKNLLLLLLLAGCNGLTSSPTADPARSAAEDSVALRAMLNAPTAVMLSPEGPFDGEWYRKSDNVPGLEHLSIGHDTLGRYNVNIWLNQDRSNTEAFTAYTSGDSLRIFGNPDHHSPAMGLHLAAGRQRMILSYLLTDFPEQPTSRTVRDTFWLDSMRVRHY